MSTKDSCCGRSEKCCKLQSTGEKLDAINSVLVKFRLRDETKPGGKKPGLLEICRRMTGQIEQGLTKEGQPTSDIKMYPTFVESLPTGKETGDFLALDLGGTWFRVLFFRLNGKGGIEYAAKPLVQAVPQEIMLGHGSNFFDFMVNAIDSMIERLIAEGHVKADGEMPDFPLGFTFSFPCRQLAIDSALLTKWTKGFACADVPGNDVVALLHQARDRKKDRKFTFHCSCLINDTVGCLTSLAVSEPDTRVGVIFGTGTNACYTERIERIGTLPAFYHVKETTNTMLVNMEWGAFGSISHCLDDVRNDYDKQLDGNSLNLGEQLYEKMISGMYMGEILRLMLVDLVKLGLLFANVEDKESLTKSKLFQRYQLQTKYLSDIENDALPRHAVRKVLADLGIDQLCVSDMDCDIIYDASEAVSSRAANLSAVGLATVLKRIDTPPGGVIVVGVDGSLVRYHRHFRQQLEAKTRQLLDAMKCENVLFRIELSEDGSGLGTAAVAAACRRPL